MYKIIYTYCNVVVLYRNVPIRTSPIATRLRFRPR